MSVKHTEYQQIFQTTLSNGYIYPLNRHHWNSFHERFSQNQDHSEAKRIKSMRTPSDPIRNQTHKLPSCNTVSTDCITAYHHHIQLVTSLHWYSLLSSYTASNLIPPTLENETVRQAHKQHNQDYTCNLLNSPSCHILYCENSSWFQSSS